MIPIWSGARLFRGGPGALSSAVLALLVLLWAGGWSPDAKADAGAAASGEIAAGTGEWPALWSLSDHDTQIYLFGTVHILPADAEWRSPLLERALSEADILVLEADLLSDAGRREAQAAYRDNAWAPPDAPLSFYLTPEQAKWLDAWALESGVNRNSLERLRPWAAFLTVTQVKLRAAAGPQSSSAEESLAALDLRGLASGARELRFLETAREQVEIFAGLPDADVAAMLADLLCQEYGDCAPELEVGAGRRAD